MPQAPEPHGPRPSLSACIIARDEARAIPDCLASVAFCDEVVVVDSGSTDATVDLALASGARVIAQDWLGFAAQRNVALDHATGDWVLEIDADERVSPQLRREIASFLAGPAKEFSLAGVPRREVFLGGQLTWSAKYPCYSHRLLLRGAYRHDEARTVHEGLIPTGPVYPFDGELTHLLAAGWREAVADAWRYAGLEAGQLQAPRTLAAFMRGAILRPPAKFAYRVLVDAGWRDGWRGIAKIALDCLVDATVATRHLLGRRGAETGSSGVAAGSHYGARHFYRGSPRLVGVALGPAARAAAGAWLAEARDAGADVALVSDAQAPDDWHGVRVRRLGGFGPVALARALDAEQRLRAIDGVPAFGPRARLFTRLVPIHLRGHLRDPAAVSPEVAVPAALRSRPAAG
jgi:glycosyltransferase involved in cell wall biosynthesis